MPEWKRKTFVTRGPDPTQVVVWSNGSDTITEFQGVYQLEGPMMDMETLVEELHKALERAHHAETWQEDSDIEDAERAAGWDPNP